MARPSSLSAPSDTLVLNALRVTREPMTAYGLLEALKPSGIRSAVIIYRALEVLIAQGKVHKINELSAYVACDCEDDHHHSLSVLAICGECREVEELHDHAVIHHLEHLREQGIRLQTHAVIELPVICAGCAA
jgi:Fur family transcriptional regulator, zinc uptake regulator